MSRMDYYRILGISREASGEDIKKAYRKLVFEHHPDRNPGNSDAEETIREINRAYEIIGDAEKRRSYDRLYWNGEPRADTVDLGAVLTNMEQTLFNEGRRELFALLMQDVTRIKEELQLIRKRTVADQGYDSFHERIVEGRAAEIMDEFLTEDMQQRKQWLLDVATNMMVSQGVVTQGDERAIRQLRSQLEASFIKGRLHGIASALELFYERR